MSFKKLQQWKDEFPERYEKQRTKMRLTKLRRDPNANPEEIKMLQERYDILDTSAREKRRQKATDYRDQVNQWRELRTTNTMEIPAITIAPEAIRSALTDLINEFIRIEKSSSGLEYQQRSNFVRGQINLLTSFFNEEWNYKESGQSYYDYLHSLVEKYSLSGVWKINDLH